MLQILAMVLACATINIQAMEDDSGRLYPQTILTDCDAARKFVCATEHLKSTKNLLHGTCNEEFCEKMVDKLPLWQAIQTIAGKDGCVGTTRTCDILFFNLKNHLNTCEVDTCTGLNLKPLEEKIRELLSPFRKASERAPCLQITETDEDYCKKIALPLMNYCIDLDNGKNKMPLTHEKIVSAKNAQLALGFLQASWVTWEKVIKNKEHIINELGRQLSEKIKKENPARFWYGIGSLALLAAMLGTKKIFDQSTALGFLSCACIAPALWWTAQNALQEHWKLNHLISTKLAGVRKTLDKVLVAKQ